MKYTCFIAQFPHIIFKVVLLRLVMKATSKRMVAHLILKFATDTVFALSAFELIFMSTNSLKKMLIIIFDNEGIDKFYKCDLSE